MGADTWSQYLGTMETNSFCIWILENSSEKGHSGNEPELLSRVWLIDRFKDYLYDKIFTMFSRPSSITLNSKRTQIKQIACQMDRSDTTLQLHKWASSGSKIRTRLLDFQIAICEYQKYDQPLLLGTI